MPPKKKQPVPQPPRIELDESSEEDVIMDTIIKVTDNKTKPVFIKETSNNDRIRLANAINNLTIKSDELINTMKEFDSFRESIMKLDIEMETKKHEYNELLSNLESNHKNKIKELNNEYEEKHRTLSQRYQDMNKRLESEYQDKNINQQNELKNGQINVKQKLTEFKIKACQEMANENNMVLIKQEDYNMLNTQKQKAISEYEELKKSFDAQCNSIRRDEQTKYQHQLTNDLSMSDLTHKANNAEIKAQVEQQRREIDVLNNTISSLKNELAEQRSLTKEVAQASAKSQITQKFGKD